ncbi:MAG: hypothetical protein HQ510_12910 [Candidatus Marinimicrobia bacterium]|nr:hypothetical protein [Candidatus Neomarinimicrobiota bacterium]
MNIIQKLSTFRADWLDVTSLKVAMFFATLCVAKIWAPLLSLDWYWYLAGWIIFGIRPIMTSYRWLFKS